MNKILVLDSVTSDSNFKRQSASFYRHMDYYEGRLHDYDTVIIRHINQKTDEVALSSPINKDTFLAGLDIFSKEDQETGHVARGLYYRW